MFRCHSPKSSLRLQLPCLDFQFLRDLTASNINTSPFPRYLLSPLILALHPHFTYRLNCIQSQNSKVNKLPGLRSPFFVTWASLVAQLVKNLPAMWETWVWSVGWEDLLKKGKATHSSILAWRIPWTIWSVISKESDKTERLSLHFLVTGPLPFLALKLLENGLLQTLSPTFLAPCSGSAHCHRPLLPRQANRPLVSHVTSYPLLLLSRKSYLQFLPE